MRYTGVGPNSQSVGTLIPVQFTVSEEVSKGDENADKKEGK